MGNMMFQDKWVGETDTETGFYQSIEVAEQVVEAQSDFQKIDVYKSDHFGKILVLDGVVQITERDGDSYNEMMAHVPLFQHKNPKRALIIGGGDGYVLQEVLKHDSIEHVDHVELDKQVVETCKKHFPYRKAWDDDRVHLHIKDGSEFVRDAQENFYDVVIQDSSDPWESHSGERKPLPSMVLYEKQHFENIYKTLTKNGIFNLQAESINFPTLRENIAVWRNQALSVRFLSARYCSMTTPSYPTGQIGMLVCEKQPSQCSSMKEIQERYDKMIKEEGNETTYYHPPLQESAFQCLPLWAKKAIYGDE